MRIIPLLISIFAILSAVPLGGQNCGCADEGNCPYPFNSNSTGQVCYEITDAFNNNLANANQGVCGVYVRFRHGRVGGMDLTLTSPSGQQVQLVGTNGSCNTWTPIALWDILFLPCAETCEPDTVNGCAFPCVFDGCPNVCPWSNATFTGSYHPYLGCLENFNTGPANGQWCLEIDNDSPFNGGSILDFEVILCDQSGILCCEANAGNLAFEPNVNACVGDSALILDLNPIYGSIVPDPLLHGYTYAIFQNNSLIAYDSMPDMRPYLPGTYQVCGLSYLYQDTASMPDVGDPLTPVGLHNNLNGPSPDFCGDIDTNCIIVTIASPPAPFNFLDTICVGDTVFVGNSFYTDSGMHSDTFPSFGGCDSIVNLTLTVLLPDTTALTGTICDGEDFLVGTQAFHQTGQYEVTLQNRFGCDSTVFLNLTVLPPITTSLVDTICSGDSVVIGPAAYHAAGIYVDTLVSFFNCDSIITLDLSVVEVTVSVAVPDTLDCQQTTVSLDANATTNIGTLGYVWTTNGGSFVGDTLQPSVQVDDPGTYFVTATANGCTASDSVHVLENGDIPTAVAVSLSPDTLTCLVLNVQLDATGSSGTGTLSYQWSAQNGSPISNPSSPTPTVTFPDTYELLVTDISNGCTDEASVAIFQNTILPTANAGADTILSCTVPSIMLDGSASVPIGHLSFQWVTGNGHILPPANVPNPVVDEPGNYELIVTDLENGCQDNDLVVVSLDTLAPHAVITIPDPDSLTCTNTQVTLDGSGSTGSSGLQYQWVGNIAGGQGTPIATVANPGIFSLILNDPSNGCADTATITVVLDTMPPVADAGPDTIITCIVISPGVGGPGTSVGTNFIYEWTSTPGGSIIDASDSMRVRVNAPGTYYLTVTNTQNGCTAIDSVAVEKNPNPIVADAGPDFALTCQDTTFTLNGINSTLPSNAVVEWSDIAGNLISTNMQVTVNYPDTFIFTASLFVCKNSDTVIVSQLTAPPAALAGPDMLLDCNTGQAMLDGSGSAAGPDILYQWTTPDGFILLGETGLAPTVTSPGVYILEVSDGGTNCVNYDTAFVSLDTAACMPSAYAGADGFVNCYSNPDTLTDVVGSTGPNFSYQWTAISGMVEDQSNPFAPVLSAGQFVFAVTNEAVWLTGYDTVSVFADTVSPVANVEDTLILSLGCQQLSNCYQLDASASSQGPGIVYTWESLDGIFCSTLDVLNAEILGPGLYDLLVTNTNNGCTASDGVLVQLLDFQPMASAGPNRQIPCGETTVTLNGTASSIDSQYVYDWYSAGGNILSGGNTLTPVVSPNNSQDTFFLVVTNSINLCQDTNYAIVFAPANCVPHCGATASDVLDCDTDSVFVCATGASFGPDISYQWTALSGSLCGSPTDSCTCVDAAGIFQLTVIRTYPNGAVFDSTCQVQVLDSGQLPTANAGPDKNLTCTLSQIALDGSGSSSGTGITYQWAASPGQFVSGETTLNPVVNAPGNYTLTVTNTLTGCVASDMVQVGVDTLHPIAVAGPDEMITCSNTTVTLMGGPVVPGVTFKWTTQDGNICSNQNLPNATVCDDGTYYLTVTSTANGCTAVDSVIVTESSDVPQANAGPDLLFTCVDTVLVVAATASTVSGVASYQWTTADGCIVGPSNILNITVDCPGTYQLEVTDDVSLCPAFSSMMVVADNQPPTANAGSDQEINCQNLTITLDGSGSIPSGQLDFVWSTTDGHFISSPNMATVTADSAGLYVLTVTDQHNQCTATDVALVTVDANIPLAIAGKDTTLTCARTSLQLSGAGSTTGPNILYKWSANPGNISNAATTLAPEINQPGTYVLEVTDTSSLCVVTDTVLVTLDLEQPVALIDLAQNLLLDCNHPQLMLDGSASSPLGNVSYSWSTQNGHIVSGTLNAVSTVDSAGVYKLTVTHGRTGCTAAVDVTVTRDFTLPSVAFAIPPVLTCVQLTAQLEVFPPGNPADYTYQWSGPGIILNSSSSTPTVNQQGLYRVTITDITNGCENDSSVAVLQNKALPAAEAAALGTIDCDNLTTQLTGIGSSTGNVTYLWTTNAGGVISTPNSILTEVDVPGIYYLTVMRLDNGCTATDSTNVVASSLPIDGALFTLDHPDCVDPDGYIFIDTVFGGTPPYYYSVDGEVAIAYPELSFLSAGLHELTVQDVNGCVWMDTVLLLAPGEILVELGDDIYIVQGQTADLEAQLSIPIAAVDSIFWVNLPDSTECPQCLEQVVSPDETTTYRIYVMDTLGCMGTDQITVVVNEERPFYVPNAFSPDGNNINDLLLLYAGPDVANVVAFRIFDRWGDQVFFRENFQPNDPRFGWDGKFEGQPMDAAVFVWLAEVEFVDGDRKVFYGDVVLMR
ncbi:MAG: gliding motility-associated C-terminal domain-containing protein [Lewinellaceae bacterium]|nr:gliding motility-associated C-terminal domain-containing protein [Lewinellaceae bacterium]